MKLEYLEKLPKKRSSSGVIIFDCEKRILLVKPSYRDDWLVPGGVDELNESPLNSSLREVKEEIGIDIEIDRLVTFDYNFAAENYLEGFKFTFVSKTISADQIERIKIDNNEITEYKFVERNTLSDYLSGKLYDRIQISLEAYDNEKTYYLEGQRKVLLGSG